MASQGDSNEFDNNNPEPNENNKDNNANGNGGSDGANSSHIISFDPEGYYYDMTGEKHLVIFNHYEYHVNTNQEKRDYTDKDVEALEATFSSIGFTVDIYDDKDRRTIWDVLLKMQNTDYSRASCVCIVILTHGSDHGLLLAYDLPYKLDDVINMFEGHPTLAGKPKLFFIQACRGNKMDDGIKVQTDGEMKGNYFIIPTHADFLVVKSTVEDYISWRNEQGSWMVQELCKAVRAFHEQLDILQILTIIHRAVAFAYSSYVVDHEKKVCVEKSYKRQMIETSFTLTKFLKL